jgi:hypothetical protein
MKKLKYLIIHSKIYDDVRRNLLKDDDTTDPINIVSSNGNKIIVGRKFVIQGLLKHNFQKPFSSSMEKIIQQQREKEQK